MSKSKVSVLDYILVIIQLGLFVAYFRAHPAAKDFLRDFIQVLGAIPMIIGAVIIIWAFIQLKGNISIFPTPKSGAKLVTNGIFAMLRHPIYAGLIYFFFGLGIYRWSQYKLIAAFIIFVFFEIKSSYEERKLAARFEDYNDYKLTTGKFFPYEIKLRNKKENAEPEFEIEDTSDK
jgi:protein-S-isoprenylcysteine O-methyltransferase Ste14